MKPFVIVSLALTLALPLAACQKMGEKLAEKAAEKAIEAQSGGKAEVDLSGGKLTIKSTEPGKEGTFEISGGADAKIPDDFPKDVPVYPQAKVSSAMKANEGQMVTLDTEDKGDAVFAFYQKKMAAEGWKLVQELKMPPSYNLHFEKADRTANILVGDKDAGSTIALTLATRK
jgi:hypothetical protein